MIFLKNYLPVAVALLLGSQGNAESPNGSQIAPSGSGGIAGVPSAAAAAIASPISRSDNVKSAGGSPYYTNDLAAFVAQAAAAVPSNADARLSSASAPSAVSAPASAGINSMNLGGIPYQAIIQALASSASSAAASPVASQTAAASTPTANWASPSSWINSGSGLWSMFSKPSTLVNGQRRSSLTSRLRNIVNTLFYRRETSTPYMQSGSSNHYSYRPAPYGFGQNSGSASNMFAYGNSPSFADSLYSGLTPSASSNYASMLGSMYGASSNFRPSFVMPNTFDQGTAWAAPNYGKQGGGGGGGNGYGNGGSRGAQYGGQGSASGFGGNNGGASGYGQSGAGAGAGAGGNYGQGGNGYGNNNAGGYGGQQGYQQASGSSGAWSNLDNSSPYSSGSSQNSGAIWSSGSNSNSQNSGNGFGYTGDQSSAASNFYPTYQQMPSSQQSTSQSVSATSGSSSNQFADRNQNA